MSNSLSATPTVAEVNALISTAVAAALVTASASSSMPAGIVIASPKLTVPEGFLACNGGTFNATTYPDLYAYLGITTLPDYRGVALRGVDSGRGLDSGRTINTYQADDFKSHTHTGSDFTTRSATFSAGNTTSSYAVPAADILSGATGGTETRMKNTSVQWCIKY